MLAAHWKGLFNVLYREAKHSAAADPQSAKVSTNTATYNILRICLSYSNFHLQMPACTQHVLAKMPQMGGLNKPPLAFHQQVRLLFHPLSTSSSSISIWNTMLDQIASVLCWSIALQWIKLSPNCFYSQLECKFWQKLVISLEEITLGTCIEWINLDTYVSYTHSYL